MVFQSITLEQFENYINRPENYDTMFEYIAGEAVEKLPNAYLSSIAVKISFYISLHLRQNKIDGHVTGEHGGYQIGGERYAPDVAYMPASKQAELDKSGYNSVPPDLAVEVLSSDRKEELSQLRIKITNYLFVGTTVWVVKSDEQQIEVHQSGQPVTIYRAGDTLDGGDVLPNFKMPLADIFGSGSNK